MACHLPALVTALGSNIMKKEKHITINIDEWQYSILQEIAKKADRNITNLCYMFIKKHIDGYAYNKGYYEK